MKDLQVTFYDIISILLPASLVLAILHFQTGLIQSDLLARIVDNSLGVTATAGTSSSTGALPGIAGFAIPFVVAYLLGHAINLISKYMQDSARFKRILIPRVKIDKNKIVFNKGTFPIAFEKEVGEKILEKLANFYGISFTADDYLDNYVMASLSAAGAAKRDIFIAIACMMRNTAVIAFGFALFFAGDLIRLAVLHDPMQNEVVFLVISLVAWLLFRYGFAKYQGYAESLIYSVFLTAVRPTGLPEGIAYQPRTPQAQATQVSSVAVHPDVVNSHT